MGNFPDTMMDWVMFLVGSAVATGLFVLLGMIITDAVARHTHRDSAIFTDMGQAREYHRACLDSGGSVRVHKYEYGVEMTCIGGDDK